MKSKNYFLLVVLIFFSGITSFSQTWQCGQNLTDDRDGQVYPTVLIGNQCWMAENLNYGNMILNVSGQGGQRMQDNGIVEKYCWNNDEDYCNGTNGKIRKGGLYEFKEAVQFYNGQPLQPVTGVCPEGWHIPSYAEINTLLVNLGGDVALAYAKMIPGGSSGFNAAQVGYRCTLSGSFLNGALGTDAVYYWISEQSKTNPAYALFLVLDKGMPQVQIWEFDKSIGASVRCLKNSSNSSPDILQNNTVLSGIFKENPSTLILDIQSPSRQSLDIAVYDVHGKVIIKVTKEILPGKNQVNIDIPYDLKGIFMVQIRNEKENLTRKVVF